jgi:glycine C-acetyltransferase
MRDLFAKCSEPGGYFSELRLERDRYFTHAPLGGSPGPRMTFEGRPVIQWSINDYLGRAARPELLEAAREAAGRWGVGAPMGSRFLTGNTARHEELEARLARLAGKGGAVLFNYGYLGVLGTVASLVGPDDIILIDKLAHASMMDAAMATQRFLPFNHDDLASLEAALRRATRDRDGGVLIMVEGVYGMTGDLADLPGIVRLKEQYGARLFVDDAHGFGALGPGGRGTGHHLGAQDGVDVYFGTFAKAFAAIGGFAAADDAVAEYIRWNARTQIFAKSLPMVVVEVLHRTLDLLAVEHEALLARLWENTRALQDGLRALGYFLGRTRSPVTPVFIPMGEVEMVRTVIRRMRDKGVFVSGVTYPVVPKGVVLCRLIPTAAHTAADVAETLRAFAELRDELGLELDRFGHAERLFGKAAS